MLNSSSSSIRSSTVSSESAPMSARKDGLFGIRSRGTLSCSEIVFSIRSRSSPFPARENVRVSTDDLRNQISCPQFGHVASPKKTDGSITIAALHSGHRADSPSGVREEIVTSIGAFLVRRTVAICGRRELTNHWNKSHHRRSVSSHCSTTPTESARGEIINEN